MDFEDIPEIDPAIPIEPDFFDAEDSDGIAALMDVSGGSADERSPGLGLDSILVGEANAELSTAPLPAPGDLVSNILQGIENADLKYDDELCEFDQFLVGVGGATPATNKTNNAGQEVSKPTTPNKLENEVSSVTSEKSSVTQDEVFNEDRPTADHSSQDKDKSSTVGSKAGKVRCASASRSNTPDSKSAIKVTLPTVPKPRLNSGRRISIPRGSPKKKKSPTISPVPRTTRGKLNENPITSRAKRKLSSDFEYDSKSNDETDDDSPRGRRRVMTKSRSIRTSKKVSRYGFEDQSDDDEDDEADIKSRASGRARRKNPRYNNNTKEEPEYGAEADVVSVASTGSTESLFERLTQPLMPAPSFWYFDDNGTVIYKDSSGRTTSLPVAFVRLVRLTENEIAKYSRAGDPILVEICIDNFQSAKAAVEGGAQRIELCSSLSEGGLTPTCGFLTVVKETFKDINVFVMIRPRGGDFLYSQEELEIMSRDIAHYKQLGADGFVFGALTEDCKVDEEANRMLRETAYPLECTFHRAFDKVVDPFAALETVIRLGFTRILTSGLEATAEAGIPKLKRLVDAANGRIIILAGSGVNEKNVRKIVRQTGVKEVHGSASVKVASRMCVPGPSKSNLKRRGRAKRASAVKMGSVDDTIIKVTDPQIVKQIIRNARW